MPLTAKQRFEVRRALGAPTLQTLISQTPQRVSPQPQKRVQMPIVPLQQSRFGGVKQKPLQQIRRPVGSFKKGGTVKKTGLYKLHKGEKILPKRKK